MTEIPFIKMHGAGNDFVILDNRAAHYEIDRAWALKLAHRQLGIGCDQMVVLEKPSDDHEADVAIRIYNHDGSEIGACGNASRCVGWLLMEELGRDEVAVATPAGVLIAQRAGAHQVSVDMGAPKLEWRDIPLSEPRNTEHLGISEGALMDPVAVNMGNPHMVFFVRDLQFAALDEWGPMLERHPLYPQRANVSAAEVVAKDFIKLQVWERGAGLTLACGTAACATVVAGVRRGLCNRVVTVSLPGGELVIDWQEGDNHVMMTGPVATVFRGTFDLSLILA